MTAKGFVLIERERSVIMVFNAPNAVPKTPGDNRSLWRRLFMEGLDGYPPSCESIEHALYSAALLTDCPLIPVVDALVELGLRAPVEAFPEGWVAAFKRRVLDVEMRSHLSFPLASVAASWGWMSPPLPKLIVPQELCIESDPYGTDLLCMLVEELGPSPLFGYKPATMRMALLQTALGMGRPLSEVVTALLTRGVILPHEVVPAGCREHLRLTATHPLVLEMLASWKASQQQIADIIPFKRAQ